jgi:hypothetical protein
VMLMNMWQVSFLQRIRIRKEINAVRFKSKKIELRNEDKETYTPAEEPSLHSLVFQYPSFGDALPHV